MIVVGAKHCEPVEIMKDIIILGIETSCDDTSVSIVKNGREVLSNVISSQIDIHKIYGGVVPEIASRKHTDNISIVYNEAIKESKIDVNDIDCIAVTYGPGLIGSLLVGLSFAKGLSISLNKPFIGINHIEGHISSNYITNKELEPPFLCLIVSGGHTNLVLVEDYCKYKIYGKTHDDACGECFDKVARTLGLDYPGGPKIEKYAKECNEDCYNFPRGNIIENEFDFTFSGLKSHIINFINNKKVKISKSNDISSVILDDNEISKICFSFQNSIIDSITSKTISLAMKLNIDKVAICGGVSANNTIKTALDNICKENNIKFYAPENVYSTDNAAMIASAGYYRYVRNEFSDLSLNAVSNLEF